MRWKTKATLQRALGVVPFGMRLNYVLQRRVTHTYPRSGPALEAVVETARRHLDAVARFGQHVEWIRQFEFGAGWDLATPVAFAALGVPSQVVVDIRRVARPELARGVVDELRATGLPLPDLPATGSIEDVVAALGIDYRAPSDARDTGLPSASVDVVTSTSTLEHIPPDDIAAILVEMNRVLAPGGLCSFAIDYHDHYAGQDPSITGWNFLQFDDDSWRRWNTDLQFQNRLEHRAYVELFEASPLDIVEVVAVPDPGLPTDPPRAPQFADRADLDIGDGWFVLRAT